MLLEHALVLHREKIVPLKGVWIDVNRKTHEGRVLTITRDEGDTYHIVLEGLWGSRPVTVTQARNDSRAKTDGPFDVQFGSLILKVDHFRSDPIEWLAQHGFNISELNAREHQPASEPTL